MLHVPECSHRKKRVKQIQKMSQRGLLDPEKEDPFALFVASTSIRCLPGSALHVKLSAFVCVSSRERLAVNSLWHINSHA